MIKVVKKHPIIYLLIILVIIEICLQVLALTPADDVVVRSPLTHHEYRPNIKFITISSRGDRFPAVINRINSFGTRGTEIRKKVSRRILCIGDSFIQADEVSFQDTFSEKLNKYFRGRLGFIAHGIGSWSPTTEFSWIYYKGIKLLPDEVNIFLCANDFYREGIYTGSDVVYQKIAIYKDTIPVGYRIEMAHEKGVLAKLKSALKKIKLMRFAFRSAKSAIFRRPHREEDVSPIANELILFSQESNQWPKSLKESVEATVSVIKNLQLYLQEQNIEFNCLLVPLAFEWKDENIYGKQLYGWEKDFTTSQIGLENYLKARFKELTINYIDLGDGFRKKKLLDSQIHLFNESDTHWNKNGHQVIFEILRNYYVNKLSRS